MTQLTLQESIPEQTRYNKRCPYCGDTGIGKLPFHLTDCSEAQATGAVVDE